MVSYFDVVMTAAMLPAYGFVTQSGSYLIPATCKLAFAEGFSPLLANSYHFAF